MYVFFTGSVDPNLQSPAHNLNASYHQAGSQGSPYSNHASVQGSPPRDGLLLGVSTCFFYLVLWEIPYSKFAPLILFFKSNSKSIINLILKLNDTAIVK